MTSSAAHDSLKTLHAAKPQRRVIYRHSALVRATHWINAICFFFLLMSGLQIFNAHPALYWGAQSDFRPPRRRADRRAAERRFDPRA